MTALRVLAVIARPSDVPPFDAESAWRALSTSLRAGQIELERLVPATENALKKRLAGGEWHVVHFIGCVKSRGSAQYATLTLESSTGTSRNVSASYFESLLEQQSAGMRAAVIVDAFARYSRPSSEFAYELYTRLAAGASVTSALTRAGGGAVATPKVIVLRDIAPAASARTVVIEEPVLAAPASAVVRDPIEEERQAARNEIERKRAASEFDVFLCHNGLDKPQVREIAERLEARGILPWLDENELRPGQPWQPLLERQMASIKAAAVFVGAAGVGPWQEQELYGFLREFVSRSSPVIPVLLQDAPEKPALPILLRGMTWVDFRVEDPEPLARLIWGITGRRPTDD